MFQDPQGISEYIRLKARMYTVFFLYVRDTYRKVEFLN